jgi:CBS domain-containing protein
MFDEQVGRIMRDGKLVKASPETVVSRAAALMAAENVGALVVVEHERLVGIFTERDIVFRVVAQGLDPSDTPIAEVMTRDVVTVAPGRPFGYALALMHRGGFRHLPVVEDGRPLGIVSARSALDPNLEEFASEKSRRQHYDDMVGGKG